MARKLMSIYIPQKHLSRDPVSRLRELGRKKDRSIDYLVMEAIFEYLKREEQEEQKG